MHTPITTNGDFMMISNTTFSLKKFMIPTLLASLTVGCGWFKDKKDDESPEVARDESQTKDWLENTGKESHLMGSWKSECAGSKLFKAHKQNVFKFEGDIFTHVERYYINDEGNCDGESAITVLYEGNFKLKDKNTDLDARDADFEYKKSYVTAHGDKGVDALNAIKSCGVDNWKKHHKEEVTSKGGSLDCPIFKIPKERIDILKIDGDKLSFGEFTGSSWDFPHKRPTHIDKKNVFQKD